MGHLKLKLDVWHVLQNEAAWVYVTNKIPRIKAQAALLSAKYSTVVSPSSRFTLSSLFLRIDLQSLSRSCESAKILHKPRWIKITLLVMPWVSPGVKWQFGVKGEGNSLLSKKNIRSDSKNSIPHYWVTANKKSLFLQSKQHSVNFLVKSFPYIFFGCKFEISVSSVMM